MYDFGVYDSNDDDDNVSFDYFHIFDFVPLDCASGSLSLASSSLNFVVKWNQIIILTHMTHEKGFCY